MNVHSSATQDGRKTAPVYIIGEGELMLNASPKDVWPHVLDYSSWQNYSIVQHVSGPPGQEGEVVLLQKDEAGVKSTPYLARTIKLDPGRRVIWKTYRENANYFGIVEFRIDEMQGKTRFYWSLLYEHIVSYEHESELETFRRQQYAYFDTLSSCIFPKLKKRVEKDRAQDA